MIRDIPGFSQPSIITASRGARLACLRTSGVAHARDPVVSRDIPRHPAGSPGISTMIAGDLKAGSPGISTMIAGDLKAGSPGISTMIAGDLDDDRRGHIQGSTGISTGRRGSRGGSQGTVGDSRVVDSCSSSASMHLDLGRSACQRSRDVPGFSRPSIITASRGGGAPGLRAYAPRA